MKIIKAAVGIFGEKSQREWFGVRDHHPSLSTPSLHPAITAMCFILQDNKLKVRRQGEELTDMSMMHALQTEAARWLTSSRNSPSTNQNEYVKDVKANEWSWVQRKISTFSLRPLQLLIAERVMKFLHNKTKKYSTNCSFNPLIKRYVVQNKWVQCSFCYVLSKATCCFLLPSWYFFWPVCKALIDEPLSREQLAAPDTLLFCLFRMIHAPYNQAKPWWEWQISEGDWDRRRGWLNQQGNRALPQETISIAMCRTSTTVGHKTPPAMVNATAAC